MQRVTTRVVPRGVSTVPSPSGQPPPDDRSTVFNGGSQWWSTAVNTIEPPPNDDDQRRSTVANHRHVRNVPGQTWQLTWRGGDYNPPA
ncbi:hypothetical protein Tco_1453506 [Tanacetum coccineum]